MEKTFNLKIKTSDIRMSEEDLALVAFQAEQILNAQTPKRGNKDLVKCRFHINNKHDG